MTEKLKKFFKDPIRILIILALIWAAWSWVLFTETVSLDLLEGEDVQVKIAFITDLHSCYYGREQHTLTDRIEKMQPDMVILGGDIFDDKKKDDNARILVEQLAAEYPCYYVAGNHEFWSGRADEFKTYLKDIGVKVLEGNCETITVKGTLVDICGVDDPDGFVSIFQWREQVEQAYAGTDESHLRILVSHRPEEVDTYAKYDFDLVLTGHAHGGQIRIPFLNRGVIAPNQGLMAEYVSGLYELANGKLMLVSPGLARESTPLPRYFNHPRLILVEIH